MNAALKQVESCLRIYRDRGNEALFALQDGSDEKAMESLKWRRAAYFNFRFYDERAQQSDPDYLQREPFVGLFREITQVDQKLARELEQQYTQAQTEWRRTRMMIGKIQRFRSGNNRSHAFQRSI